MCRLTETKMLAGMTDNSSNETFTLCSLLCHNNFLKKLILTKDPKWWLLEPGKQVCLQPPGPQRKDDEISFSKKSDYSLD